MKSLKKYIIDTNFDFLDNQVLEHCYVSYAFEKEGPTSYFTFESLGLFNGCKEIVNYIIDNIEDFYKKKSISIKFEDINGLTNHYFDELILKFSKDNEYGIHGGYEIGYSEDNKNDEYEKTRWNNEKNIFNFIKITLYNCDISNENDIAEILTHELMHSWDDYVLHINSYDSLRYRNMTNSLKKEFEEIKRNIKNKKIMCLLSFDFDKMSEYSNKLKDFDFIEKLIYYLDKFEINAYVAQINQILRNKHFDNVKDAIKYIVNESASYYNYKCIYDLAFAENGNTFVEHGASESQLKKIQKLASKAWRKIVNHTYHICVNNIEKKLNEGSSKLKFKELIIKIWKR